MVGDEERRIPLELPVEVENQLIAGQIQWYLDMAAQVGRGGRHGTGALLKGKDNPDFEVNLFKHQKGEEDLPEEIEYPVYRLNDWRIGMDMTRVTVSGRWLDEYFKDQEGRVYASVNSYYFNFRGQAVKSEEVREMTEGINVEEVKEMLERRGLHYEELREVESVPTGKEVKFVNLEPGDYEKVQGILEQIRKGELVIS